MTINGAALLDYGPAQQKIYRHNQDQKKTQHQRLRLVIRHVKGKCRHTGLEVSRMEKVVSSKRGVCFRPKMRNRAAF